MVVPDVAAWLLTPSPLTVLLMALAGAPLTAVAGWGRPRVGAGVAVASSLAALLLVVAAWRSGGGAESFAWAPSWGLTFALKFDGLSAVYGLLATGIGALVLIYSSAYLPRHLHHHGRDPREATPFYALILLFMGAMVGLVMADDLILLFIFWDLTAIVSYFLIGFDRDEPASRPAALMALVITGGTAILMLAGIVALWILSGTTSIQTLAESEAGGLAFTIAVALIVVSALAKSAQVPLHFWLPHAMVAPTPVSSYLHSAAMVAAGVFLIARLLPLVERTSGVSEALIVIGFASTMIGGLLALGRDEMKRLLAYSTIGQYGYVVMMLGIGGAYGAIGAAFYVLAHALAKCALFLTAGAVTEATGRTRLSELGGLASSMPLLAVVSGIATATLAALPLTIGFFKDEAFFAAMFGRGAAFTVAAVLAAALTFAYIGRFWGSIFLGPQRVAAAPLPTAMSAPIALLALLCVLGGIWPAPANLLANAAGSATIAAPVETSLAYHLDTRPENLMALAAYALGGLTLATIGVWSATSRRFAAATERVGPERFYRDSLELLNRLSDWSYGLEVHDLRGRVAWVLAPVGVFVLLGLVFTSNENAFLARPIEPGEYVLVLVLVVAAGAALTATQIADHLPAALLLSAVGFLLATVYAFLGAPDVALVAVLMETMITLLFLGFLSAMRDRPRIEGFEHDPSESHRGRDRALGIAAGAAAFVVNWGVLSKPAAIESASQDQIALTPAAHARDVVTAILADFRGLDTMGEITVIGIAMIGLMTLVQRPHVRRMRK
jgi:multicomponent Na+:H+ antiporter subunit A